MKKTKQTKGVKLLNEKIDLIKRASCGSLGKNEIAAKLGITVTTIDHWLKGRRRPTLEQAVMLRKYFKIKVDAWTKMA